jgi:eukaryotic-like serine/threonine-protein kinase
VGHRPAVFAPDGRGYNVSGDAAGQLNHPNVLAVHDVGVHDGAPYIVSELLAGESLEHA